ncbi:MAG: hypothetical protein GY882_12905 [Actinomycetia bacterium]|nr:hypothetical protein [Actinomycetes bacterium]MCP4843474.1 hypothetical protein [Actinomycetes bacterium]
MSISEAISEGLILITNGGIAALAAATSLWAVCVAISGACLAWIARIETDEYDRMATKPRIGRV